MAINWVLPVRIAQLVLSIIVLGLTAYGNLQPSSIPSAFKRTPFSLMTDVSVCIVANQYNGTSSYNGGYYYSRGNAAPSQVNFLIFCAVWSILAVAFLILSPHYDTRARHVGHKFAILAVDAVTAIFWFAGFVALAVFIGVPDCGNNHVCGALQASVAFGAFLW
jgi:hypothetical protein